MNIYALEGHRVVCDTYEAGYPVEREDAEKHLVIGQTYTVDRTEVGGWSTCVYLKEFPGKGFNSVFFKDAEDQPVEKGKEHPDWSRYNR